ncbi:iron-sulfur cluster carrier protein ApbC [Ectothiorhodospira mobilis]|uniref:iron-sulfur cluster carrier protein ApbC n=1 Tax=Ectothiorhodospira mobilis TaxID=195064 RepID=UPI001EE9AB3E|nr:iron-sulfur cluster carrier protein ApbC [Ectothiorhodospira mobilis]MCG5534878.1 iron-sulfur cluster carrier protein ApbC [Ectothiorhodospira mobilis]
MTDVSRLKVETVLKEIQDPYLQRDLVSGGEVKDIQVDDAGRVRVQLCLGYPAAGWHEALKAQVQERLSAIDGVDEVAVEVQTRIVPHAVQSSLKPLPGIRNIIAVASGKGGVGKSTTAVNLALALAADGARVGILDADIYGPSQPRMLGIHGKPETRDGKTMEPLEGHGLQAMSIGFLIEEDTPMIWRGPMVTQALEQLLRETNWRELDYLVIDLPPGTGDTQLTLAQKIPVSGAVIITTPQDIALSDARKGLKMFEKVDVPVLGVVENMSIYICPQCGHEEYLFGQGGGERMAEECRAEFLGALPLDIGIREQADGGNPTVAADPEGRVAELYRDIARRTAARLALQARDYSDRFPNIVVEND